MNCFLFQTQIRPTNKTKKILFDDDHVDIEEKQKNSKIKPIEK